MGKEAAQSTVKGCSRCPTHQHQVHGVPQGVDLQKEHRQQCTACLKSVRYCQRCQGWSSTSHANWNKQHNCAKCCADRKVVVSGKRKEVAALKTRDLVSGTGRFSVKASNVLPPGARRRAALQKRDGQSRTMEECGLSWISGERGRLPDQLHDHALNITGPSGGYTPIHRHGFSVANVCCLGTKEYLFAPSQPLHLVKGDAGHLLARDTISKLAGAAHLASIAKEGQGCVYKAVLKADDAGAPNVIVWPPGCYHEIHTPGPYAGLHFYTVPPSAKLLQESLAWNFSGVCQVWADELKSVGVGDDALHAWYRRACTSVLVTASQHT
ncbi:hypothetical protein JKP88DRAFT_246725 [Tribonema minus]|uniref:Uncharacterized protein n=1 Tax=Tribonema minus TaxID=303371 RepID=A0A835YSH5_9STRA|nr:hypothetical protein JKP88DRAFT_246725 [Tribonema minus]